MGKIGFMKKTLQQNFPLPPFYQTLSRAYPTLFEGCQSLISVLASFDDSTHQLWLCQFPSEKRFLKLCLSGEQSAFWQAVQHLFGFELASNLKHYDQVYQSMTAWSPLVVPKLRHSASYSCTEKEGTLFSAPLRGRKFSGFLLTEFLVGRVLTPEQLTLKHVSQISEHIALLHQHSSNRFGALFDPHKISSSINQDRFAWKSRLKQTLLALKKHQSIPMDVFEKTIGLVDALQINHFQPIMLDMRWDQFLQLEGGENLALLDLDAMVWAPRELELVMLEYLLTPAQAEVFTTVYTQYHELPDLKSARSVYRVLLFQMNVLGESSFNRWMAHPVCF